MKAPHEIVIAMRTITKLLSVAAASVMLIGGAPAAHAASHTYDFSGEFLAAEVIMPKTPIGLFNGPTLSIENNTEWKWSCYSLLGSPDKIRPVLDVYLYSEDANYSADVDAANMITDAPDWSVGAGNSHIGPMNPGATYSERSTYVTPLNGESLAVFTKCSSYERLYTKIFHYTVVDESGNEVPELIPDVAAIRAEIEYVEPVVPVEPDEPEPEVPFVPEPPARSGSSLLSS